MKIENSYQYNQFLGNLITQIKLLPTKVTIVIGGSWHYGEPLVVNGKLKSDLDLYLITSWRDFFKILKNKEQIKKNKINLLNSLVRLKFSEIDNNQPLFKNWIIKSQNFKINSEHINLHFLPYFFLKYSFYKFHGQVISQGKYKVIHLLNRQDADKATLINCLKRGYLELIKAYLRNDNVALANSAKNIVICLIIKSGRPRQENLFQLKNLIPLISFLDNLKQAEKQLLVALLTDRLNNQIEIFQKNDWFNLRKIINRVYLSTHSTFTWRHWLLYNFYFLPKKKFTFLFKNPNKLILESEYWCVNSFKNGTVDKDFFKKSVRMVNQIEKIINYDQEEKKLAELCFRKIEKYCNIVFVI